MHAQQVEVRLERRLLTVLLCDPVCQAEQTLGSAKAGERLLREHSEACSDELWLPLGALVRHTLGEGVRYAQLTDAPRTRHEVLLAVRTDERE